MPLQVVGAFSYPAHLAQVRLLDEWNRADMAQWEKRDAAVAAKNLAERSAALRAARQAAAAASASAATAQAAPAQAELK